MTPQIAIWIGLTLIVASLAQECVQRLRRRGQRRRLWEIPMILISVSSLLGDSHPVWQYACLGAGSVLTARSLIVDRKKIEWRSPMMRALVLLALMIILAELAHDVIPGVPRPVMLALAWAVGASSVVFFGSIVWEFVGAFRIPSDKQPSKP